MVRVAFLLFLVLGACASVPPDLPDRQAPIKLALPPMKTFANGNPDPPRRSNADIAQDFLDLSFRMESGRELPFMTRFEGPITVRVHSGAPASLDRDLDALLARMRSEAGIQIRRTEKTTANINIQAVPRAQLQRLVPQAACFVVPNVRDWDGYRRLRRTVGTDWAALTSRQTVGVFLPSDVSPQEVRDCLHEELAQGIGPLNDLYRLPDSVFNDDNFHAVLTGFDMLILKLYYHPDLRNGMTRTEAAAVVPRILAGINPRGRGVASRNAAPTPVAWIRDMEAALGPGVSQSRRRQATRSAIGTLQDVGISDNRLAFSLFVLGRLSLGEDAEAALTAFLHSAQIYAAIPGADVQEAHVVMHLAVFALSSGQPDIALEMVNRNLPVVARSENAALLSTMLMIKSEALDVLGRSGEAQAVRLDSLGWARYGFGSEKEVRARLNEIAALNPGKIDG